MQHALATLLGVVQRSLRTHAMVAPGDRVLVAVSGGPDSTGLLLVLARLRRKLGIDLIAAHIHHGLRGAEADGDEGCAAENAARLDVPFVRCALQLVDGANLEARARTQRYAALRALAAEHGCTKIATGHTLDDQAETVLMRLIRGSGGRGLAAIRPRRADGVIRPLIDCPRQGVAAVVRDAGLRYRLDRSNRDPRHLRTHVRERVLPLLAELNPAIARACANAAAAVRSESGIVAACVEAQLAAAAVDRGLALTALVAMVPALRAVLVRHWLVRAGVPRRTVTARHVAAILALTESERDGAEIHLPRGWTVRRLGHCLRADRDPSPGRRLARGGAGTI